MTQLSLAQLLDIAQQAFDLEDDTPLQRIPAVRLPIWLRPFGMPQEPRSVAAWIENREGQAAHYDPPLAPYPISAALPLLVDAALADLDVALLAELLGQRYPAEHRLRLALVDGARSASSVFDVRLADLPTTALPVASASQLLVFVPALAPAADRRSAEALRWVIARLLGPGGCPWDVQQSHQDLRSALLEETYEALEAIDAGDMPALSEELGDLLISVFAHSEMARQAGHFSIEDVFDQVVQKLIRRHPHVFAELAGIGTDEVLQNWEQIKAQELAEKGRSRASLLDGVPPGLPALAAAQKISARAARAGFEWPQIEQVWAKLAEELAELREAQADPVHAAQELGDVIFVLVVLGRWLKIDVESSLRETNSRFRRRFAGVEQGAAATGRALTDLPIDELLALWDIAKQAERAES
jgi:tetrapyrrole methylase family protein/MazG family protein